MIQVGGVRQLAVGDPRADEVAELIPVAYGEPGANRGRGWQPPR